MAASVPLDTKQGSFDPGIVRFANDASAQDDKPLYEAN